MSVPTVFLSAATVDLEDLRNILDEAFREAGFRVLTQGKSLGMPPKDVRHMLVSRIAESDCIIHLAGMGYGSDAADAFPGFPCSWTQFEYYHAHQEDKAVIAFVCARDLSRAGFTEEGDGAERERKTALQEAHRERVKSGKFDGTPLAATARRTLNRPVDSLHQMLVAVAGCVREVQGLGQAGAAVADRLTFRSTLHQLPPNPLGQGFVGREGDLAELRAQVAKGGALITGLKGMGGIGKTALALVLAHEWAARFPDAQLFLDARGTQADPPSARKLMEQVVLAFHPTAKLPDDDAAIAGIYRDVLGGKKVLILLDNARDAAQAKPLIPPAGCALIVTSRHSFMLGTVKPHDVGRLPEAEAVALLREFAPDLTEAEAATLVPLCAGLPLALRLAGSHIALDAAERNGPPDIAGYILALGGGRLATLDAEAADAGEVTISETLRLSEAQLPEAERDAWRKLGVFTASFDARAAEAIGGANDEMLRHFVRRSLLEREGAEHFKLHDLAADYARVQLGDDTLAGLHLAHARHYTAIGDDSQNLYQQGDAVGGLALLDRERAQIEAAYAWLAGHEDESAARLMISLVNAVAHTCHLRFHPRQRIAWLESQLRAARIVKHPEAEDNALGNLGTVYFALGDARKAIDYFEQELAIAREIGNRNGEGTAMANLGSAYTSLSDMRKAIDCYEKASTLLREIGNRVGEGSVRGNLGTLYLRSGDAHKAIGHYEQASAILREIGNREGEGTFIGSIGDAYHHLGDLRKAIEFYKQALAIAREIGNLAEEGRILKCLGEAHVHFADMHKAIDFFERALAIAREIGNREIEGDTLGSIGHAHYSLGDAHKAIDFFEQQLVIAREIGDRRGEGQALGNLGAAYQILWDIPRVIQYAEQALALARETGDRNSEGIWLHNLAEAQLTLGDFPRAREHCATSLAIATETGHRLLEANVLWLEAQIDHRAGNVSSAFAHAEAALRIHEAIEASAEAAKVRAKLAAWRGEP